MLNKFPLLCFILAVIFTCSSLATKINPDLRTLFDCTKVAPLRIFDYPTVMNCDHHIGSVVENIQIYRAEVFNYTLKVTKFLTYHYKYVKIHLLATTKISFAEA